MGTIDLKLIGILINIKLAFEFHGPEGNQH
jgi:hypothetical protein